MQPTTTIIVRPWNAATLILRITIISLVVITGYAFTTFNTRGVDFWAGVDMLGSNFSALLLTPYLKNITFDVMIQFIYHHRVGVSHDHIWGSHRIGACAPRRPKLSAPLAYHHHQRSYGIRTGCPHRIVGTNFCSVGRAWQCGSRARHDLPLGGLPHQSICRVV